ncbi:MAG: hypothetical protein E7553_01725 [Ruminococcaceae bacterium]|nr:hypothetical protein [Oscillospiraceae bacterium]
MAESGFFRVSFRGFNKQDVLQYIDELQTAHTGRLAELEDLRLQAENALESERANASAFNTRIQELEQEIAQLKEQIERLNALAQIYKAELITLREQQAEVESCSAVSDDLAQALARNRELEEQVALLKEQNARYASVVGDVSRLVVEARIVSASYLDAAQKKSSECIKDLDVFLTQLKEQVEKVRLGSDAHRQAGDAHIETLLEELQGLGESLSSADE